MIKAVIVDDEPPARRELLRLLAAHKNVRVVGEAGDVDAARGLLLRTRPDAVFLDIRLGRRSGFDLLPDVDPETSVVFVTAYDHYAVKAFEASAVDYLLKPVDTARLRSSIEKLERRAVPSTQTVYSRKKWVFLDSGETQEFLKVEDITHIEADEGGSRVHSRDGKRRPGGRSLLEWQHTLDPDDFVRVHRSTIVNLHHVERIERWFHYAYRIHLSGSKNPVIMSRRYASKVRGVFG